MLFLCFGEIYIKKGQVANLTSSKINSIYNSSINRKSDQRKCTASQCWEHSRQWKWIMPINIFLLVIRRCVADRFYFISVCCALYLAFSTAVKCWFWFWPSERKILAVCVFHSSIILFSSISVACFRQSLNTMSKSYSK